LKRCRRNPSRRLVGRESTGISYGRDNSDNHLKNLSFMVGADGIESSPAYDLLSTGAYHTRAFAGARADWPRVPLAIAIPDAPTLEAVTRNALLGAGESLGLPRTIGARELNRMVAALPNALTDLIQEITAENAQLPKAAKRFLAGEIRLLNTLQRIVLPEMLGRLN
jgi:serine/threonine-protein kinase HipA